MSDHENIPVATGEASIILAIFAFAAVVSVTLCYFIVLTLL